MLYISNEGTIQLVRGDTLELSLFINSNNETMPVRYHLTENDVIYFAVMESHQRFEDAIIKKVYTAENRELNENGDLLINLDSQETENLVEGKYYYTVKMKSTSDVGYNVYTLIPARQFYIIN